MVTALRAAIFAALALALPGDALAQAVCPENVIRIIVPFPPGGPIKGIGILRNPVAEAMAGSGRVAAE
jgi:hypothetical protein